ncbi:MAG: cyclic pyranopterin monophosphate synthase MoaC [Deltaproteobacteria bacterium]|jgi:cyclic pyranopterin phosphate synthase|nr:cyclic pyranopterin monophosphate synthase MoaC [Deltaproteobacteria bacterium]
MSVSRQVDASGAARMVDVGDKPDSARWATACARVKMSAKLAARIGEKAMAKGDVLAVARLAGIMAAKRTADLIPLCHPVRLDAVRVDFTLGEGCVDVRARASAHDRTGVEMEALTAACITALTIYDMCKSADRTMVIEYVRLEEKAGGKSGHFRRPAAAGEP